MGEVQWKQLVMVVGSEVLKFEDEETAAGGDPSRPSADEAQMFASPRGTPP